MLIYCICTQYLVGAPFALITASIRRGMDVISLWHCWGGMEAQVYLTVAFSSSAFFGLLFLIIIYNKYVYIYVFNGIDSVDKTRPVLFDAVMILLDSVKIQSVVKLKLNIWLNKTLTLLMVWMIQSVPCISEHCFRRVWITLHESFITLIILLCFFVVVCMIFILLWSSKSYLFFSTKDKV